MLGLQERAAQAFPGTVRPPLLLLLSEQHPQVPGGRAAPVLGADPEGRGAGSDGGKSGARRRGGTGRALRTRGDINTVPVRLPLLLLVAWAQDRSQSRGRLRAFARGAPLRGWTRTQQPPAAALSGPWTRGWARAASASSPVPGPTGGPQRAPVFAGEAVSPSEGWGHPPAQRSSARGACVPAREGRGPGRRAQSAAGAGVWPEAPAPSASGVTAGLALSSLAPGLRTAPPAFTRAYMRKASLFWKAVR